MQKGMLSTCNRIGIMDYLLIMGGNHIHAGLRSSYAGPISSNKEFCNLLVQSVKRSWCDQLRNVPANIKSAG